MTGSNAINRMMANVQIARAKVILFKPSGKYYTEEEWIIPWEAQGPFDMINSVNFRRIDGGAVFVCSGDPLQGTGWGYPHLFPPQLTKKSLIEILQERLDDSWPVRDA